MTCFPADTFLGVGAGGTLTSLSLPGEFAGAALQSLHPPPTPDGTRHRCGLTSLHSCQAEAVATSSAFPAVFSWAPEPKCCGSAKLNSTQLSCCFTKDKLKGRRNVFAFVISLTSRYFLAGFAGEWELPAELRWLQSHCWARNEDFSRVIFLFLGFHISVAASSSPTMPDVKHCADSERTVS